MLMQANGSLTQQGRLLRTFVGLAVAVSAVVFGPQAFADDAPGAGLAVDTAASSAFAPAGEFDTYTVAQGETLWAIAVAVSGPEHNAQDTVRAIMELNAMSSASVLPGDQILVPPLG